MRTRTWILTTLFLVAGTAPPAAAQADEYVDTTLYFHIFDTFNKFPINTQPYNASFFDVGGTNIPTVEEQGYDQNTVYGFSSAGPVEYQFIENGRPRIHPERGIAKDVDIEPGSQPMVYLYIDPRGFFGDEETPGFVHGMTFQVTVREGDDVGADLDAGQTIMQGEQTVHLADTTFQPTDWTGVILVENCPGHLGDPIPHTDCPKVSANDQLTDGQDGPDGHPIRVPNEDGVVELAIPMTLDKTTISQDEAFNVRIDWFQRAEGNIDDDQVAQGNLRLVLDQDYLPRMELRVKEPVEIVSLHPQVAGGILLVHAQVLDAWGTYDIDYEGVEVTFDGPAQPQDIRQVVTSHQHVHGRHHEAAELTYLWDFRAEDAPDGEYTITMTARNLAGDAEATKTATFVIDGDLAIGYDDTGEPVQGADDEQKKRDSPAPLVLIPVALAFLLRRRSA